MDDRASNDQEIAACSYGIGGGGHAFLVAQFAFRHTDAWGHEDRFGAEIAAQGGGFVWRADQSIDTRIDGEASQRARVFLETARDAQGSKIGLIE